MTNQEPEVGAQDPSSGNSLQVFLARRSQAVEPDQREEKGKETTKATEEEEKSLDGVHPSGQPFTKRHHINI